MCGITGYFGPTVPNTTLLADSLLALRHRGPNGEGSFVLESNDWWLVLNHNRLAILDLDQRSNQPFHFEQGVLVFNGEIYNYVEIRRELISLGHIFTTTGDTEVLAHALSEWGVDTFDKLEGMWTLAWYDQQNKTLLLSRDRFGEKPLFLWRQKEGLYFSSEVKGLAALSGKQPRINQNHLIRYLVNGYKSLYKTTETFFSGVEELPPASYLIIDSKGITGPTSYWTPLLAINEALSYKSAVDMVREALISSMALRLRSDVPVAFCMSGGVDSNTLISIAQKVFGFEVHGFTIKSSDRRYDESALVAESVKSLGMKHTDVRLNSDGFLNNLKNQIVQHDGPISTISYYAHWQLMQAISAHGYKVAISGTGADELFTGYYDHHNLYLAEVANNPSEYLAARSAWTAHIANDVRNPYLIDPELYQNTPEFRQHIYLNNDVFATFLLEEWEEPFTENDYGLKLLRNRMLNELFQESVPVILREDDLNSMAFSIENRSPFLDRKLFECAFSLPSGYLVRNGYTKSVLRDAMRGMVPDSILSSRKKIGFNASINELLDTNDLQVREFILDNGPVYDIVKRSCIEDLINETELPNSFSKFLFNFINIKLFLDLSF